MKKRKDWPARRDCRLTSQYVPDDGSIVIGVAKGGVSGAGEVMYRLESEKLAGAIEDRKELAVIVNNLGLLALSALCGFNLAESLEELPKSLAKWGHIDVAALTAEDKTEEALRIAQKTMADLAEKTECGKESDGTLCDLPSNHDGACVE